MFRFEVWAMDRELKDKRVDSGNAYAIRKIFIETLMDMQEDSWKRMAGPNQHIRRKSSSILLICSRAISLGEE